MLGSSCSIPRPGRASSAYLLESSDRAIVVDFGHGAFANLVRYRSPDSLDAIVVSHMHADHFLDVVPLRYALRYGPRSRPGRIALYLPPGGETMLRELAHAFDGESRDFLGDAFEVRTFDPNGPLEIGSIRIHFTETKHFVVSFAMRFACDGANLTYSSDTAPDDRIAAFARDTDVFLCEATLSEEEESDTPRGHLSAREAGALAAAARAKRLVLTHYPATSDAGTLTAAAAMSFDGPITVADDGLTLALSGHRAVRV